MLTLLFHNVVKRYALHNHHVRATLDNSSCYFLLTYFLLIRSQIAFLHLKKFYHNIRVVMRVSIHFVSWPINRYNNNFVHVYNYLRKAIYLALYNK